MELYQAFIMAGITGFISSITTIVAIKTDISWIKAGMEKLEKRLLTLEGKINHVEMAKITHTRT